MKTSDPHSKPAPESIDRDLLEVPLETALVNLVPRARRLMGEPGRIEHLESKFRALCISILSIHHRLEVEQALRLAERLWSEALHQGPVSKQQRKARKQIPDAEHSDYKAGYVWVFDDSLELHRDQKVSIESTSTLLPSEGKVTFGTSAHDDMLTAERKVGKGGRHYILVRRARIDEEANTLGRELPLHCPRRTRYPTDNDPNGTTTARLKRLPRARQTDVMKAWFAAHYVGSSTLSEDEEDPLEGPYTAIDLLWSEFDGVVQEHVIRDLADELDGESRRWVPANPSKNSRNADIRSQEEIKHLLLSHIRSLREELERIELLCGRFGHNNPPEDERLFPFSWEQRNQILQALDKLAGQTESDTPDEAQVKATTSVLRSAAAKVWGIAKQKVDKATDKMAETVGIAALLKAKDAPAIYHWILDTASSLYSKLEAVIHTAEIWLKSLHLPF